MLIQFDAGRSGATDEHENLDVVGYWNSPDVQALDHEDFLAAILGILRRRNVPKATIVLRDVSIVKPGDEY